MENKVAFSFKGIYFRSMDSYGRIVIPVNFRKVLTFSGHIRVVISKLDKSIVAYTFEEWEKVKKTTLSLAIKSDIVKKFRNHFICHAKERSLDKRGRILVPYSLRQYAELENKIVFVGLLSHFEILSLRTWNKLPKEIKNAINSGELVDLWSVKQRRNNMPDIIA